MKAVLLVSHGSRSSKTKEEVADLARILKLKTGVKIFEFAFLEIEKPTIPDGLDLCVRKGATEVMVLLNFLNSGRHVNDDIPAIVRGAQSRYPQVRFAISPPIGQHERIADLFVDLIQHA
ncbi:MAG: cobalamin biosynthesis protein CbiX [Candidatus Omnitrophica bacterium]|nr:cobalamin biosynthesis protein CbiX [Candidatus Omnitrophota bacterium]